MGTMWLITLYCESLATKLSVFNEFERCDCCVLFLFVVSPLHSTESPITNILPLNNCISTHSHLFHLNDLIPPFQPVISMNAHYLVNRINESYRSQPQWVNRSSCVRRISSSAFLRFSLKRKHEKIRIGLQ